MALRVRFLVIPECSALVSDPFKIALPQASDASLPPRGQAASAWVPAGGIGLMDILYLLIPLSVVLVLLILL